MKDLIICRCEEVSLKEIEDAIDGGADTINEIKRCTRAGMGLCQGRTCRKLVEKILSHKKNLDPNKIKPANYRPPVRPIKMENLKEDE